MENENQVVPATVNVRGFLTEMIMAIGTVAARADKFDQSALDAQEEKLKDVKADSDRYSGYWMTERSKSEKLDKEVKDLKVKESTLTLQLAAAHEKIARLELELVKYSPARLVHQGPGAETSAAHPSTIIGDAPTLDKDM